MLPQSRSEKLALAKDKLNKFQKSRTRNSHSIILESAIIGTNVNGQHLSSIMSSHGGGSSTHGDRMSDSKTHKSIKTVSSSPSRNQVDTSFAATILSPIHSEGALNQLLNGIDNLQINSAGSQNTRQLPLPDARSVSPAISQSTERERRYSIRKDQVADDAESLKVQDLQKSNKELCEKIVLLEDAILNLKESFNSDKEALSIQNEQLLEALASQENIDSSIVQSNVKELEDELSLAISERSVLENELNIALQQLANSQNDILDTDTMCNDEVQSLKAQLAEYQSLIASLQSSTAEAERTITELEDAKQLICDDASLSQRNEKDDESQYAISQIQESVKEHLEIEKQLRTQIATLVCQVDKSEEIDAHNQQEISRLKIIVHSLTTQLEELDIKLQNLEAESSHEISLLLEKIVILEAELELAKSHETESSDPVQARLIHYRSESEYLRKENQELRDRIYLLEEETQKSDVNLLNDLQNVVQLKTEKIEILKQKAHREQQTVDLKIAQLHIKNEQQAVELQEARTANSSRNPTPDSYEINSLREQLQLIEKDYREQIFHLNLEISNLREKGDNSTDNSYLIEELQAINEAQVLELQAAQIDIENIKLQHSDEIDLLKQQLSDSLSAGNSNNNFLPELQRINEDQMFEMETLRINISKLEESHKQEIEKIKKDSKAVERFYQSEIESMNEQINKISLNAHSQDIIENLQLENEALALQIETLKSDMEIERASSKLILETQTACISETLIPSEEVQALKAQIESQSIEIKSLVDTIEGMNNAKVLEVSTSIVSIDEFQKLKAKTTELIKENDTLKVLFNENEELKNENEFLMIEVESLKFNIDEIKNSEALKVDDLEKKNEELQQRLESLQIDFVSSQEQANYDEVNVLTTQLSILGDEFNLKIEENQSIFRELEVYKQKLEEFGDQTLMLETIRDLTDQNAVLKEVIIKSKSSSFIPESESLDIQLREEKERVEELEEIIESNTAKYGEMIAFHEEELLSLQKKIEEIQNSSAAATDDLKLQLQESEDYCSELAEIIESNKETYEKIVTEHEEAMQRYQSDIEALENKIREFDQEVIGNDEKNSREVTSLQEQNDDLQQKNITLEAELFEFKEKLMPMESLQLQIREASDNIEYLNTCLRESDSRYAALQIQSEDSNNYYAAALEAETNEKNDLLSKLHIIDSGNMSQQNSTEELEKKIDELNCLIQQKDVENASLVEELKVESDKSRNFVLNNESDVQALQETIQRLTEEKYELEMHLLNLQTENQNLTDQAAGTVYTHEEKGFQNGGVIEVNEVEALRASLHESEETIKALEQLMKDNSEKTKLQMEQESAKMEGLQAEIVSLQTEIQTMREKMSSLKMDIQNLNTDLSLKNDEYLSLTQKIEEKEESHEQELKKKRAEIEKTLLELETCNLTIADLKSQLDQANTSALQWEEYCNNTLAEQESYYHAQIEKIQSLALPANSLDTGSGFNNNDDPYIFNNTELDSDINQDQSPVAHSDTINQDQSQIAHSDTIDLNGNTEMPFTPENIPESSKFDDSLSHQISELSGKLQNLSDFIFRIYLKVSKSNAHFSEDSDALEKMIQEIELELDSHNSNQIDIKSELVSENLQYKVEQMQSIVDEGIKERDSLNVQFHEALLSSEYLKNVNADLESRFSLIQSRLEEYEFQDNENSQIYNEKISTMSEQLKELEAALESERFLIQDLKIENESEIQATRSELEARITESNLVIEEWQKYCSNLELQKDELSQELLRLSEEHQAEIDALQLTISNLKESDTIKIAEIEKLTRELESLLQEKLSLTSNAQSTAEYEEQILSLTMELEGKKLDLHNLEQSVKDLQLYESKIQEVEFSRGELLNELNSKNQELDSLNANVNQTISEMQEKTNQSNSIIKNLEDEISNLKTEKNDLELKLQQHEDDRNEAYSKIAEYDEYILGLENEKASIFQELQESQYAYSQMISQNQEYADGMQSEMTSLTEQLNVYYNNELSLKANLDEAVDLSNSKDSIIQQYDAELNQLRLNQQNITDATTKESEDTIKQLKEEFDELAILYANNAHEIEDFKARFLPSDSASLSVQDTLNATERMALNNLIASLESEKTSLIGDLKRLKNQLITHKELQEKFEVSEAKIKSLEKQITEANDFKEESNRRLNRTEAEVKSLEEDAHDLQLRARESDRLVSKLKSDILYAEERVRSVELDREHFIVEKNRIREKFEIDLFNEQNRAREHLQSRLNSSFDATMDELQQKQIHLEQMLDESERQLIEERMTHHQREQTMVEDIRYYRDTNTWVPPSPRFDIAQDRMLLDQKIHELLNENRRLQRIADTQGNEFLKEKYGLLNEIAALKHDLDTISANHEIVKKLQEQKNDLEFKLSQKEEQMSRLKELAQKSGLMDFSHEQALSTDREKLALENILEAKETELENAEMKIHQLLNERNDRVDELELHNKQLKAQIALYNEYTSDDDIRLNFSNLEVFNTQVLLAIGEMFSKTIGILERKFVPGNMPDISRIQSRCITLIQEFHSLKQFSRKLSLWRSDLIYQKRYLCLKVEDLEASADVVFEFLNTKGIKVKNPSLTNLNSSSSRQRWKRTCHCVIAILRMRY